MNRRTLPKFAAAIGLVLLSGLAVIGAGKQVHPTSAAAAPAPFVLAVLADHYATGEEEEFDLDVENFFKRGLLVDSYFKDHLSDIKIVTYFAATPSGQESRFGFKIGAGAGNCAVQATGSTPADINTVIGTDYVSHVIVIGNHPYTFGCSTDTWTYVAVDAVGTDVLPHEMGHIIGDLYDEWPLAANGHTPYPDIIPVTDYRNCGTTPPGLGWMSYLSPTDDTEGCKLYASGIYRAYDHCRMGATPHHKEFCEVCRKRMNWSFDFMYDPTIDPNIYTNPGFSTTEPRLRSSHEPATEPRFHIMNASFMQQPPTTRRARPAVSVIDVWRILLEFTPDARKLEIKQRTFAKGPYVPSYKRVGKYVYEVSDGISVLEVGVIPDRQFEAHGYRGGAPHQTQTKPSTQFTLGIPRLNPEAVKGKTFSVVIYELPKDVNTPIISRDAFARLRKDYPAMAEVARTTLK
jgi:hypothetical protein